MGREKFAIRFSWPLLCLLPWLAEAAKPRPAHTLAHRKADDSTDSTAPLLHSTIDTRPAHQLKRHAAVRYDCGQCAAWAPEWKQAELSGSRGKQAGCCLACCHFTPPAMQHPISLARPPLHCFLLCSSRTLGGTRLDSTRLRVAPATPAAQPPVNQQPHQPCRARRTPRAKSTATHRTFRVRKMAVCKGRRVARCGSRSCCAQSSCCCLSHLLFVSSDMGRQECVQQLQALQHQILIAQGTD